jgi:hypothetical protein
MCLVGAYLTSVNTESFFPDMLFYVWEQNEQGTTRYRFWRPNKLSGSAERPTFRIQNEVDQGFVRRIDKQEADSILSSWGY